MSAQGSSLPELSRRVSRIERLLDEHGQVELQRALRYSTADPRGSLNKSRLVLELIVGDVYRRSGGPATKKSLGEMISDPGLRAEVRSQRILGYIEFVQRFGNLGSHAGATVFSSEALRALDALCEIVEWYLGRYVLEAPAELGGDAPPGSAVGPKDQKAAAASAGEVASGPTVQPPNPPRPARSRSGCALLALSLLVVLLVTGAVAIYVLSWPGEPAPVRAPAPSRVASPTFAPDPPPRRPPRGDREQADKLNAKAYAFFKAKRYAEAAVFWQQAAQVDPSYPIADGNRAWALLLLERHAECIVAASACLQVEDDPGRRAHCYANRGRCQRAQGQLPEAEESFARSLQAKERADVRREYESVRQERARAGLVPR